MGFGLRFGSTIGSAGVLIGRQVLAQGWPVIDKAEMMSRSQFLKWRVCAFLMMDVEKEVF